MVLQINRIIPLLFIVAASMVALILIPGLSAKETSSKPYKSTTVDECIEEKECVWHHLVLALQIKPINRVATQDIAIRKWFSPVKIITNGKKAKAYEYQFVQLLESIGSFYDQSILIDQNYNFIIVFTDDIEASLENEFSILSQRIFGDETFLSAYKEGTQKRRDKCYYFNVRDTDNKNAIISSFAFIQNDHLKPKSCLRKSLYAGFGLADISYNPILDGQIDLNKYSKLELFLIFVLYQDFFKAGMSYEQVRSIFDKTYDSMIKYVKNSGVLDD